jgi:hypothetical protein
LGITAFKLAGSKRSPKALENVDGLLTTKERVSFQMADDHDSTLPDGFEYLDPPPGWPPSRSAEELRQMALRLQKALERDRAFSDSCRRISSRLKAWDDA